MTPTLPLPSAGSCLAGTGRGAWRRRIHRLWTFGRRRPFAAMMAGLLLLAVVIAAVPGAVAPHDPLQQSPQRALQPASRAHPFGTDVFGRDVFSRVVYGARSTLIVGFGAVFVGLAVATLAGAASAYAGGWVDTTLQRLVDAMMALPWLVILMSVMTLVGPGLVNTLLVIGLLSAPAMSRVIRGAVLSIQRSEYVLVARALGCSPPRILVRHILPSVTAPLIVLASTGIGAAILAEASLSFLGFGVVPPTPAWGYMLGVEGRRFLTAAPWLAIFPGAAIAVVVLSVNVLGDALRDLLDPRGRTGLVGRSERT